MTEREICFELLQSVLSVQYLKSKELASGDPGLSYPNYFENNLDKYKLNYWRNFYKHYNKGDNNRGINSTMQKGYNKMVLTKYLTTSMDKIPKGSVGFFLGKRYTKVKEINDSMKHYGLTWERKDPSLANFFIVGDDVSESDIAKNYDLKYPMVMDDELRVDTHFSVYNNSSISSLDDKKLTLYFSKTEYSNLKMICSLVQYVNRDAIKNISKFRLLRMFVDVFHKREGQVAFDLRNKEHVFLSDTVQKFCIPHLRFYVTSAYLNKSHNKFSTANISSNQGIVSIGNLITESLNYENKPSANYNMLPFFEESNEVYIKDIEEQLPSSIVNFRGITKLVGHTNVRITEAFTNKKFSMFNLYMETKLGDSIIRASIIRSEKGFECANLTSGSSYNDCNYVFLSGSMRSMDSSYLKETNERHKEYLSRKEEHGHLVDKINKLLSKIDKSIYYEEDFKKELFKSLDFKALLIYLNNLNYKFSDLGENDKKILKMKLDRVNQDLNTIRI